ncbi:hypothetical protein [Falsibacillus albus]|nr:hypothetical protein [Falsibacillus albus]
MEEKKMTNKNGKNLTVYKGKHKMNVQNRIAMKLFKSLKGMLG